MKISHAMPRPAGQDYQDARAQGMEAAPSLSMARAPLAAQGPSPRPRRALLQGAASVLAAGGLLTTHPSQASAQAAPAPSASQVQEVVVTANKRVEKIEDVGLPIQAISGAALRAQHVSSLAELAAVVPGLSYTPTAQSTPVYTLRGIGFYESSLPSYPSVSMYVDEVPLPFPAMTSHAALDLERVEVLEGPQGTLYGQNATGGAINLIAAKPSGVFGSEINVGYGSFNRAEVSGYMTGPLTDSLNARLAVDAVRSDDWQQSYTRHDTLGATRYFAGRLSFDWKPTDRLHVTANVNGWLDKSDPQAPQLEAVLPQSPSTILPGLESYPFPPANNARAADWTPSTRPFANNGFIQGAVRADWRVTDALVLTSISSYDSYTQHQSVERDGTAYRDDDETNDYGYIKSFNQELRLSNANKTSDRLNWVIGANYEHSDVDEVEYADFNDISTYPIFLYTGDVGSTRQTLANYAVFGNVEYKLLSNLTLKGGVRYTEADRSTTECSYDPGDGTFAAVFDSLANAIQQGYVPVAGFTPTGVVVPPIGKGCVSLDNVTTDGTPATYLPGAYHAKLNQNNVSWRVGLDYKVIPPLLLYVDFAKGYKAGSIPLASAATFAQYQSVTQESLMDYEGGFKLNAADYHLTLNGDIFYYDYLDKQERAKILDPIFGLLDALENIPKSHLIGGELGVGYKPIEGLTLGGTVSYTYSRVDQFSGFSESGQVTNFAGSALPYTPKLQLSLSADYRWTVGAFTPFIGATVESRSDAITQIGGDTGFVPVPSYRSSAPYGSTFKINGYTLLDLRAGFDAGSWGFSIYGKNVTNKYYVTNIFTQYDTIVKLAGMPATWGISIRKTF